MDWVAGVEGDVICEVREVGLGQGLRAGVGLQRAKEGAEFLGEVDLLGARTPRDGDEAEGHDEQVGATGRLRFRRLAALRGAPAKDFGGEALLDLAGEGRVEVRHDEEFECRQQGFVWPGQVLHCRLEAGCRRFAGDQPGRRECSFEGGEEDGGRALAPDRRRELWPIHETVRDRPLRQASTAGNRCQGKAGPAILGCCIEGGIEDQRVIAQNPGLCHRRLQLSAVARHKHERLIRACELYGKRRLKGCSSVLTTPRKPLVLSHLRGLGNLSAGAANSGC